MAGDEAGLSTLDRFLRRVPTYGAPEGCWLWVGSLSCGYGYIRDTDGRIGAHRWSYEYHVGPIPEGLVIDHLCRNRACVRPDHLEPVTTRENLLRGVGVSAMAARRTHCPHGHVLDGKKKDGGRYCRTCNCASSLAWKRAKRAAARSAA